jgi:hypothetical protein
MVQKNIQDIIYLFFLNHKHILMTQKKNTDFQEVEKRWKIIKDFFRSYLKMYKF